MRPHREGGKPAGIIITQATYDGTALTVAATSSNGYPLTVAAVRTLNDSSAVSFPLAAPPGTVTVKNDAGGAATLPVTITGGAASPTALPPVTPAPAPGPIVDTGGGSVSTGPLAVATVAAGSVPRGGTTQLDGCASAGAVSYSWSQLSGPTVNLSSATAAKPTLTVPFFTKTGDTSPVPAAPAGPARLKPGPTRQVRSSWCSRHEEARRQEHWRRGSPRYADEGPSVHRMGPLVVPGPSSTQSFAAVSCHDIREQGGQNPHGTAECRGTGRPGSNRRSGTSGATALAERTAGP